MIKILIGDKEYKVKEAKTLEEKRKGLQGIKKLPEDEGMLFYFDDEDPSMWMRGVDIPLDIIFINKDDEVTHIYKGEPNSELLVSYPNTKYVLEVNADSGIEIGDELSTDDDKDPVMKVLFQDGSELYQLWGGERIFSRANTKILIKKAKKAQASQEDKDFKALGKYMFKCIKQLDTREPEYVKSPE